jgi:hypothetical protein
MPPRSINAQLTLPNLRSGTTSDKNRPKEQSMNPPTSVAAAEKISPVTSSPPPEGKRTTSNDAKDRVAPAQRAKHHGEIDTDTDRMRTMVGRITAHSLQELEALAAELEEVREFLKAESERVQREIANHAQLNKSTLSAIRNITETIGPWKNTAPDGDEAHSIAEPPVPEPASERRGAAATNK